MEGVFTAQKRRKPFPTGKVIAFAVLVFYTLFLFVPLLIVFLTSVTSTEELTSTTSFVWFPEVTFQPYAAVFTEDVSADYLGAPSLLVGFVNTLWMTLLPLIVGLIVSGLSAFAYSKLKFPGQKTLFRVSYLISTVPLGAFNVIAYTFYSQIGWVGTPLPLIVPGMFGGMGTVFFLKMYYEGIPDSLLEAGRIDGLGIVGSFIRILFPLAVPAFVAQIIYGFVGGYNNYMGPLLYLEGVPELVTLQLVLSDVRGTFPGLGKDNIHCAAAILGMLPLIVIYCFLQKLFIEGVAVGGVKG